MPLDATHQPEQTKDGASDVDMSPLTLVKAQRDRLASQFHDLHIDHMLLQVALRNVTQQLMVAKARITELETVPGQPPSVDPGEADGGAA